VAAPVDEDGEVGLPPSGELDDEDPPSEDPDDEDPEAGVLEDSPGTELLDRESVR